MRKREHREPALVPVPELASRAARGRRYHSAFVQSEVRRLARGREPASQRDAGEANDVLVSARSRLAVLDAEARVLARVCAPYGVLTRSQLAQLAGSRRWTRAWFGEALAHAVETGLLRDLGLGFYANPRPKMDADPRPDIDGDQLSHPRIRSVRAGS